MNPNDNVQSPNAQTNPSTDETTMTTPIQPTESSPAIENRYITAFHRREADIQAVPADSLLIVNVDIPTTVTTVLGAVPQIGKLAADFKERMSCFDLAKVDGLVDDALALGSAQTRWKIATEMGASLPEMMTEALKQRDRLYLHAQALADLGVLSQASVDEIKKTGTYRGVAFEILSLVQLFSESWDKVAGKSGLTRESVLEASDVADRLVATIAERDARPKVTAAAAIVRQKAFTLLAQRYEEVRAAVGFVRWREGDADEYAPSLYAGRNNGNHKASDAAAPVVAAPDPTAPAKATQPEPVPADALPALPNARPFLTAVNA